MMKQRIARYLTIAVIALGSIPVSMAQTSTETPTPQPPTATPAPGNPIDLYGEITAVSDNTIIVNGLTVDVSRAEIDAQLAVGTLVDVEGWLVAVNEVLAREVDPFEEGDVVGELELVGEIEAVDGANIVIAGFTFDISMAEVNTALLVGEMVRVEATLVNGVLQTREVYPFVPGMDDSTDDNGMDDSNDDNGMDDSSSVPPGVTPGLSAESAIATVLSIYPNTRIVEIELKTLANGTLFWDIDTSHNIDLWIDANTGTILRIDDDRNDDSSRDDDRESSSNSGSSSDDSRDDERSESRSDDRNDDRDDRDDDRNDDNDDDDRNDDNDDDRDDDDDDDRDDDDDDDNDDDDRDDDDDDDDD